MNPDINDAVWIKQRGTLWDSVSMNFKDEFTKREIKVLKAWFMGEPFEYGNDEKYGEDLAFSWGLHWLLSPIQTWGYSESNFSNS